MKKPNECLHAAAGHCRICGTLRSHKTDIHCYACLTLRAYQHPASPARGMQRRNKKPDAQWQDMPRADALSALSGYHLDMELIESTLSDGNIVQTSFAEYRETPSGTINKCLNCPEVDNKFRLPCDPVACGGKGVCTQ